MFSQLVFKTHWKAIALIVVTSLLVAVLEGVGLSVIFPLFQGGSMDMGASVPSFIKSYLSLFDGFEMPVKMRIIAGMLLVSICLKVFFTQRNMVFILSLKNAVIRYYRIECLKKILYSGVSFFNKRKISDLNVIIDSYAEVHIGALVDLIGSTLPSVFVLVVLLFILFSLSWKMAVGALLIVGLGAGMLSFMAKAIRQRSVRMFNAKYVFNQVLFDILHGFKTIRTYGREMDMVTALDQKTANYNKVYLDSSLWTVMVGPAFEVIGAVILSAILLAGAYFVDKGSLTLGIILTFLVILARMIPPFKALNHARGSVVARIPALKDIESLLAEPENDVPKGAEPFSGIRSGIEVYQVNFAYELQGAPVLKGLSMVIPQGARAGIVGSSGTGKSTLFELLMRFYDPQSGSILIDGRDLKVFDRASWRAKIGIVAQDPFLFNDTVRVNIGFSDHSADMPRVQESARRAYAHDFIMALPQGYDTVVGERGCLLSGGQRQRIAIARALLRDPDILLFDEATSALDAESEALVQKAIMENSKGKTVITIAHRLSTLMGSDVIFVMESGRVVQKGRHEELMEVEGLYRRFVETQAV